MSSGRSSNFVGKPNTLVFFDAQGNGTPIAFGSTGRVLTSNGASVAPSFQPSGASGVATVNSRAGAVVLTGTDIPVFGASGGGHSRGAVPDPGSSSGTTRFLREDATWQVPPSAGGGVASVNSRTGAVTLVGTDIPVFVASGGSHAAGAVPDPGSSAGTAKFLREDATWALPPVTSVNTRTGAITLLGTDVPVFGASGGGHAPGAVPDPGSSSGTTRFLREDATWQVVAGGVTSVNTRTGAVTLVGTDVPAFVASGGSHAPGAVPDPGSTAGASKFLREDATWNVIPDYVGDQSDLIPANARFFLFMNDLDTSPTIADNSGNGRTFTKVTVGSGGGISSTTGQWNQGLLFNPSGGNTACASATTDYLPATSASGAFSVAFWMKTGSPPPLSCILANADGTVSTGVFAAFINTSTEICFNLFGGSSYQIGSSWTALASTPITPNVWTHVVLIKDNTTLSIYINGVLNATASGVATAIGSGHKFCLGTSDGSTSNASTVRLDDVGVWARVLTSAEITTLATVNPEAFTPTAAGLVPAPSSGDGHSKFLCSDGTWAVPPDFTGDSSTYPIPTNPQFFLKLDETSGSTFTDSGANGNAFVSTGGPGFIAGKFDGGLTLSTAYLTSSGTGYVPDLLSTDAFTISGWIKTKRTDTVVLFDHSGPGSGGQIGVRTFGGAIAVNTFDGTSTYGFGTGWTDFASTTLINNDAWHHWAFTRSTSGVFSIYIDGVLDRTTTATGQAIAGGGKNIVFHGSASPTYLVAPNDFTDPAWGHIGGLSATTLTLDDTDGANVSAAHQTVVIPSDTNNYVLWAEFPKTTGATNFPNLDMRMGSGTTSIVVNTDAGTVTDRTGWSPTGSGIEDTGDGYWRAWLYNTNTHQASVDIYLAPAFNSDASGTANVGATGSATFRNVTFALGSTPIYCDVDNIGVWTRELSATEIGYLQHDVQLNAEPKPGYVPAPAVGDAVADKYLKADGTWHDPTSDIPTFIGDQSPPPTNATVEATPHDLTSNASHTPFVVVPTQAGFTLAHTVGLTGTSDAYRVLNGLTGAASIDPTQLYCIKAKTTVYTAPTYRYGQRYANGAAFSVPTYEGYLTIDLGQPLVIDSYNVGTCNITGGGYAVASMDAWYIQASNDNATWVNIHYPDWSGSNYTTLDTHTGSVGGGTGNSWLRNYVMPNVQAFRYWRLLPVHMDTGEDATATPGTDTTVYSCAFGITEFRLFGGGVTYPDYTVSASLPDNSSGSPVITPTATGTAAFTGTDGTRAYQLFSAAGATTPVEFTLNASGDTVQFDMDFGSATPIVTAAKAAFATGNYGFTTISWSTDAITWNQADPSFYTAYDATNIAWTSGGLPRTLSARYWRFSLSHPGSGIYPYVVRLSQLWLETGTNVVWLSPRGLTGNTSYSGVVISGDIAGNPSGTNIDHLWQLFNGIATEVRYIWNRSVSDDDHSMSCVIDFGSPKVVNAYAVGLDATIGSHTPTWVVQGSADQTTWTDLARQTYGVGSTNPISGIEQLDLVATKPVVYELANTSAYRYYRIRFLEGRSVSGTVQTLDLDHIHFFAHNYDSMLPTLTSVQDPNATVIVTPEPGLVPAPNLGDRHGKFLCSDGTWAVPATVSVGDFTGATSISNGVEGLVPAPLSSDVNKFLKGDGTWSTVCLSAAPATAGAAGTAGMIAYDSSYFYVCIATNTWVRAALATW